MTVLDRAASEEDARLERLRELNVLDTEPEAVFDQMSRLAADLCGVPISLISLIDSDRQWFKANIGCVVHLSLFRTRRPDGGSSGLDDDL